MKKREKTETEKSLERFVEMTVRLERTARVRPEDRICEVCWLESIDPPQSGEDVEYVEGRYRTDPEDDFRGFAGYICDQHLSSREWAWYRYPRRNE